MLKNENDYRAARAIVDRANAYWKAHATYSRSGAPSLSADLAAHPDFAACSNDTRGLVEQYETLASPPDRLCAYVGPDEKSITTWTGHFLGSAEITASWRVHSYIGARMVQIRAIIAGKHYTGRSFGAGCSVNLRLLRRG